ncbi:putative hda1 complex protein [Neofusicoccum parvum UCRNP2]|uniref:Putative hda1 complex protein n=1 Tax=Botryosphaeria parva (strain UCR-NP2) TaxID=1287680 RepID=R1GLJ6_BOTPV|nr:putative hda1 complex protein [Neofusicoccum parvum UCRNP2]
MPAPDTSWFAAKRIIDERGSGTKRKFLVDWEDDIVTGERFTPSWEPKKNLTEALFEEWTAEKPKRDSQPSPNRKSSQHFGDARILTPAAAHVSTSKFVSVLALLSAAFSPSRVCTS